MINIPEDYDPQRQWPVEFVLHGGVGRPKPAAGENFWQRSYDRIGQPGTDYCCATGLVRSCLVAG